MINDNSICLIIPYFGRTPNYFKFFLSSCFFNDDVDFLIFSDTIEIESVPKNVKIVRCSFSEFRERVQLSFDFPISLKTPYKLCDYKPAYGLILHEYLRGYKFWGHCDCDLIFGSIRKFITNDLLNKYDRIQSKGHLSIYRNIAEVNEFFKKKHEKTFSYREVFSHDESYAFDEWGGGVSKLWFLLAPERFYNNEDLFDDIRIDKKQFLPIWKSGAIEKDFFAYRFVKGRLERIYIDSRGGLVICEDSLYVHFQKRPMIVETDNVAAFLMIPNRFIDLQSPTPALLRKWGCHRHVYWHYYSILYKNAMRKIRKLIFKLICL